MKIDGRGRLNRIITEMEEKERLKAMTPTERIDLLIFNFRGRHEFELCEEDIEAIEKLRDSLETAEAKLKAAIAATEQCERAIHKELAKMVIETGVQP